MRRWSFKLLLIVAVAASVALLSKAISEYGSAATPFSPLKIALVGDSITFGDGAMWRFASDGKKRNNRGCYPCAVRDAMQFCNPGGNVLVEMFALGGATGLKTEHLNPLKHGCSKEPNHQAGSCSFWDTLAYEDLLAFQPDVAVILLGTNDSKETDEDGLQHHFSSDMADLVRSIHAERTLVMLPPTVLRDKWGINNSRIQTIIRPGLETVAKLLKHEQRNVRILDVSLAIPPEAMELDRDPPGDGVHPPREGTLRLARCVFLDLVTWGNLGATLVDPKRCPAAAQPDCCGRGEECRRGEPWKFLSKVR